VFVSHVVLGLLRRLSQCNNPPGTLLNVSWKSPGNLLGWICRHPVEFYFISVVFLILLFYFFDYVHHRWIEKGCMAFGIYFVYYGIGCWFLACDNMLSALYAMTRPSVHPSVCLSVRLSHGWISQKRLKLGSCNFHRTVASSLQFWGDKFHPEIPTGSPRAGASNNGGLRPCGKQSIFVVRFR